MPAVPRRLKDLFAAAADLTADARVTFLDRECGGDSDLRRRVEELLAAHDRPASALERPLAGPADDGTRASPATDGTVDRPDERTAAVGDHVGPYKLLEKIGEGGMGEVWVADQLEPIKRRVAVKLIKPGMDSRSVLGRFEVERQALAVMDHPNIAKVLDAGTAADGRPYFVMELVKGTPITEFADARKLTPKQRLELFVPVCQAIQHAHMKGIIHRDIKPGNVLVALHDETPVPKVIDFGVAKAVGQQLTEMTVYTGFGALVGTPAYMAPEQATFNQLDIDTRADVYALGVLLYELLAGSPPIEKERLKRAALDEVLRLVREEEPPRPSQRLSTANTRASIAAVRGTEPARLSALLRGELDWIVMKALEKDRARRYESANGFAADVQRYLAGEPVHAHPPSTAYRLRKLFRRHRPAVLGTATVVLVLAVTTGVSVWLAVWALQAEQAANGNAQAAQFAQQEAEEQQQAALAAADLQRRTRYAAEMNLLQSAHSAGRMREVARLLEAQRPKPGEPDLRGPEWHYWNRTLNGHAREFRLPFAELTRGDAGCAYDLSPDGSSLVVARRLAGKKPVAIRLVSTADGRVLKETELAVPEALADADRLLSHTALVEFSPDGLNVFVDRYGAGASGERPIDVHERHCWRLGTGELIRLPDGRSFAEFYESRFDGFPPEAARGAENTPATPVCFHQGGEYLIVVRAPTRGDGEGREAMPASWSCWKRGGQRPLWQRPTPWPGSAEVSRYVRFLGKGGRFATIHLEGGRARVSVFDTATGDPIADFPAIPLPPGDADLRSRPMVYANQERVLASADGRRLIVAVSTGAIVIDLERSCPADAVVGAAPPPKPVWRTIESLSAVGDAIGVSGDGSTLTTLGAEREALVFRTWAIDSDAVNPRWTNLDLRDHVSRDGRLVACLDRYELRQGVALPLTVPLRVFSNRGEQIFEVPFEVPSSAGRISLLTTPVGRHLTAVWLGAIPRPATPLPGGGTPQRVGSLQLTVWDLTTRKEAARSKTEPGQLIQSAALDDKGGRIAVVFGSPPKGVPGGAASPSAFPPLIRVYSFPDLQWLQDLPLPGDTQLMPVIIHDATSDDWVVPARSGEQRKQVRWAAATGEYRGVVAPADRGYRALPMTETTAGGRTVRLVAAPSPLDPPHLEVRESTHHPGTAPLLILENSSLLRWASLSPDGSRVITIGPETKMYDVATGRELLTIPTDDSNVMSQIYKGLWSADGTEFWYARDQRGRLVGYDFRPLPETGK